jgi:hypothetical protein
MTAFPTSSYAGAHMRNKVKMPSLPVIGVIAGLGGVMQQDLFGTLERPNSDLVQDPDILAILERFGGAITVIGPLGDGSNVWIERVRPRAARYQRRAASDGGGHVVLEQMDEIIKLGKFGGYEKDKPRGSCNPWRFVWSKSGAPLGTGLFTTKEFAENWRKR